MTAIDTRLRVPELLAPAGDWEALRAAVANGADAVYFGLDQFNARHRAQNFRLDELPAIVKYLHDHNVRGFLTFNTLIFSDELPAAAGYVRAIAEAGVDAVIVQDLGLARLIHTMAPTLHIHGSTQMTLTEPRGIEFVRQLGVQRVVLARELSIEDIKKIRQQTDMETEVFIHGALCVAYSGQCLTSESLGGRSANRGQCAQACRLPYELVVDGVSRDLGDVAYLLSPQDLAAYDLVGDLSELGVTSFKIEGRLKSAHYVAATAQTYRNAIDAWRKHQTFKLSPQQRGDLEQTFSRGFSHGFLGGVNHQVLVQGRFPKSRGTRVGTVARVTPRSIVINVENTVVPLKPGDGVVFDEGHPEQDEQGGRVFVAKPVGKKQVEIELGRGDVNLHAIAPESIVWKTDDPAIRKRLEHSFSRDVVVKRTSIDAVVTAHVGQPLRVKLGDAEAIADKPLEAAMKFPVTIESVREQIGRLGDTPFELRDLKLDAVDGPMVPKSLLNDLRRSAVEKLLSNRTAKHEVRAEAMEELRSTVARASRPCQSAHSGTGETPVLHVLARTIEQLHAVLAEKPATVYCDFEDVRRYKLAVDAANAAGVPIAVATMRIVKPHEQGWLKQILECRPDAILVRNLAAISYYREAAPQMPLIGDYSLNIANELTAGVFAEAGLLRFVPSYDLNWRQMAAMFKHFDPSRFECVIHQHMPMFHMEHCVFAHTMSEGKDYRDCGRPCETHQVDLSDRVGQPHPLIPDAGCRNTVYNAQAQSAVDFVPRMLELGIRHFRVELLRETPEEVKPLLARYADVLNGKAAPAAVTRSLKVLNQLGVTHGTLDRE
jgi:putative protease